MRSRWCEARRYRCSWCAPKLDGPDGRHRENGYTSGRASWPVSQLLAEGHGLPRSAIVGSYPLHYTAAPTGDHPLAVPKPSIYNRTLRKAAEQVGGERALARYLGVPVADLYAWMQPGAQPPPTAVFLMAVDLVLNDLNITDEERAQRVRVAIIHEDQQRTAVMQKLQELLPSDEAQDTASAGTPSGVK